MPESATPEDATPESAIPGNRRVVLARRPSGAPMQTDFALTRAPFPRPGEGEFLMRNLYCSLDPAMRRWMDEDSYAGAIPLGEAIRSTCAGRVVESRCPAFAAGDHVVATGAVEDYSLARPGGFTRKIDPSDAAPLPRHLSLFGPIGMTAYFSLLEKGQPAAGETVLVSAAAGAVGSLVGQIAKLKGCRAVGIAGGAWKCARLRSEFGFDAAIDYKGKDVAALTTAIQQACPQGVDIYFDNVGGEMLEAALACINDDARIVACGMISQYNAPGPIAGPRNLWRIVAKTATVRGFLGRRYVDRFGEAVAELRRWESEGKIVAREHIEVGMENFHAAFMRLFDGSNDGKLILQID